MDAFSTNPVMDVLTRMFRHVTSKIEWFLLKTTMEKILEKTGFVNVESFEVERRAFGTVKVFMMALAKK